MSEIQRTHWSGCELTHGHHECAARVINQLQAWKEAVDEHLVVSHLGTVDSFKTPKEALNVIAAFEQGVGEYFAKERIEELEAQNRALREVLRELLDAYEDPFNTGPDHDDTVEKAKNALAAQGGGE
jgi:hypothetical protein